MNITFTVQITKNNGVFDNSSNRGVLLSNLLANGNKGSEVGDLLFSGNVWSLDIDTSSLPPDRTDRYVVEYTEDGTNFSVLKGYENFEINTDTITPAEKSDIRSLISSLDEDPPESCSVKESPSNMVVIIKGELKSPLSYYKITYSYDSGDDVIIYSKNGSVELALPAEADSKALDVAVCKINAIGVETASVNTHTTAFLGFTLDKITDKLYTSHGDGIAAKMAGKKNFASTVAGNM